MSAVLVTGLLVSMVHSQPAMADRPQEIVVKFSEDSLSPPGAGIDTVADTGGRLVRIVAPDTVVVSVSATSSALAARELATRPDVEWAEPDVTYRAALSPNDPCYVSPCRGTEQWNIRKVNAPRSWDVSTGAQSMKLAVLDSGVDVTHPDLTGRVTLGPNFSSDPLNEPDFWHGTHVAGILAAAGNNGVGLAGMNWTSPVVSVKVLDAAGSGQASRIAAGLRWSADNGVRIANLSIEGPPSRTVAEAVAYAQARGVLVVASAGNSGSFTPTYPSALVGVLSVGASDESDAVADFSNRGGWVDLVAPGVDVLSTWPTTLDSADPYRTQSGTSMAAPLVTGAAALLWSAHPYMSANGVAQRLRATTQSVAGTGTDISTGRLDAGAALADLANGYRLTASDGGVFPYGSGFHGSAGGLQLLQPIVASMSSGTGSGYWLVASDGGVFSYGDAEFLGSAGGFRLNASIVAAANTRSGNGYWMVASDGGVFSFGDALFHGSTGGMRLNRPIVSVVATATGNGYWLVASDGGVFSYGDAQFHGSAGAIALNKPIVAAGRSPSGNGYWMVASDGGVFNYGDATFYGSAGGLALAQPIVGMAPSETGNGYWLVASDGGVFSFGDAIFRGSTGAIRLNKPIVSVSTS